MDIILFQAVIYLTAAVVAVPIAARLGLGSVLGYLAAGIVIGPLLGLVGSETQDIQRIAEFGVVVMLFLIGLDLEPRALWQMRTKLAGLGGAQVALTTGILTAGGMWLGMEWSVALAIALAFTLSSTAIVLQTLSEKGLMQTGGGRATFAVLLAQDISVIPMLALLPLLVLPGVVGAADPAAAPGLLDPLPGWAEALVTVGAIGGIVLAGVFLTRPVFAFIHMTRLREMYTALALLIVIGIASLMLLLDLSPALGTFLAGVVLANSEFRHELESDLDPFKGLLLGLFFITVGAGIDFAVFFAAPLALVGVTLAMMVAKGIVLFVVAAAFGLRGRDGWLFTLGLAQAGEFTFVLIGLSLQRGVVPSDLGAQLTLVAALSMLLTPLFFLAYDVLHKRMAPDTAAPEPDAIEARGDIIIAGVGRFGQVVNRMVQMAGFRTTVLDDDLDLIRLMRQFGFKTFLGDPTRPDLLKAAGLATARVLVVAMENKAATTRIVRYARQQRPDLHIVARAYDRPHVYELYEAGASDIVREMFDSSLRAGRYVLENMGLSEYEAARMRDAFYKRDREAMLDLAELWKPGVPVTQNAAYMDRARQLNRGLETALLDAAGRASETGETQERDTKDAS